MTNGDKIRQRFADDAGLYHNHIERVEDSESGCPPDMNYGKHCPYTVYEEITENTCEACWVRWLRQEADGETAPYLYVTDDGDKWRMNMSCTPNELREMVCGAVAEVVRKSGMTNAEAGEFIADVMGDAATQINIALKARG